MTGTRRSAEVDDGLLAEFRSRLQRDPAAVAREITPLIADLRRLDNTIPLARALAIRGRARRACGEIDLADLDLAEAMTTADELGDAALTADTRIGMAGVRFLQARTDEAFALLDEADAIVAVSSDPAVAVSARLQRAAFLQHLGRVDTALDEYARMVPSLRSHGSPADLAAALGNLGTLYVGVGRLDDAVTALTECRSIAEHEGMQHAAAGATHSLGWAWARLGELRRALEYLDDASDRFAALGRDATEVDVDRIDVLLSAGLYGEAAELADTCARRLAATGDGWWAADVLLLAARAAFAAGDRAGAHRRLDEAEARSLHLGMPARLAAIRLERLAGDPASQWEDYLKCADLAASASARVLECRALALACRTAVDADSVADAMTVVGRMNERCDALGLSESEIARAEAMAAITEAMGNRPASRSWIRRGRRVIDRHVESFGAIDARLAMTAASSEFDRLDARCAAASGSAWTLLSAMERARAGLTRTHSAKEPNDHQMARLLGELRDTQMAMRPTEDADGADDDETMRLIDHQRHLERQIRRRHLATQGSTHVEPMADLSSLRHSDSCVLTLCTVDGDLLGTLWNGRRLSRLTPRPIAPLRAAADALASALRTAALRGATTLSQPGTRALAALREVIPAGVDGREVVVVVPPELAVVPWHAVVGPGVPSVVVAPSVRWWLASPDTLPNANGSRVACVAGPGLGHAVRECAAVASPWGQHATILERASAADVVAAAEAADVLHLCAHFRAHPSSPMWSAVEVADGSLTLFDLASLAAAPRLAVLSACDSGVGTRVGNARLGLATALLASGSASVIASLCPLPDSEATVRVMELLHGELSSGTQPAAALRRVAESVADSPAETVVRMLNAFGAR